MMIKMESAGGGGSNVATGTGTYPNTNNTDFVIDTGLSSISKFALIYGDNAARGCLGYDGASNKYSSGIGQYQSNIDVGSGGGAYSCSVNSVSGGTITLNTNASQASYGYITESYTWYAE